MWYRIWCQRFIVCCLKICINISNLVLTNCNSCCMISNVSGRRDRHNNLCASGSVGGARPCQGRGRGFESRLALSFNKKDIRWMSFFVKSSPAGPGHSRSTLRSGRRSAVESLGNFWLINHWSKKFSLIQTRQIQRWIQTYLFRFSCHSVTYIILAR